MAEQKKNSFQSIISSEFGEILFSTAKNVRAKTNACETRYYLSKTHLPESRYINGVPINSACGQNL